VLQVTSFKNHTRNLQFVLVPAAAVVSYLMTNESFRPNPSNWLVWFALAMALITISCYLERFPKRLTRGFPMRAERDSSFLLGGGQYGMGKPYPEELRRLAVEAVESGATIPEAAEQSGVSIRSVVRFLKLHRETGSLAPGKFGGHKDFALAAHEELVRRLVAEQPDITLGELEARLAKKVTVGKSSISRFLHHLDLPFKKKSAGRRAGPTGRRRRA